jgi:preprotein translocase subunit SecE
MSLSTYVKETQTEMKHVNWPSKEQTIRYTLLVILVSIATAALLGVSDFVFSKLLTLLF